MASVFTVALIGPDGAGKTTIAKRLPAELALPAEYVYMGVSRESSNLLLPTSRLIHAIKRARGAPPDAAGPPDPAGVRKPRPRGLRRRAFVAARSSARLGNQLAEEWYRQIVVWTHMLRGRIVVFDRHFFSDYYAYDVTGDGRPLDRRLHGFVLSRLYPKPDLVVYLDAPGEVLRARKGEGSVEALERRRGDYLALARVAKNFAVVDASRPLDDVTADVVRLVRDFAETRRVDERYAAARAA